jgi:hypothetical protein
VRNKIFCLPLIGFVHALLFLSLVVPPAFAQKATSNLKKYQVEIHPLKKQVQRKYQLKLIHPYSFRLKTIQKSLVALRFKKKDIFNVQKGRVFSNDWVKRLAPLIQGKFSQANPKQRIAFKISDASGAPYFRGDTFLTPEGLHWRFTVLRGVRWGIEDFSVSGEPWVLLLQKGQAHKQRFWKGSTQVAQDIVNWVIFKNILPVASQKLSSPKLSPWKGKKPKPTASDVKERLHLLDQLRQENVITEKEYVKKRSEILGQF